MGTAPWLVVAGLVEGYVSRVGWGWPVTLPVGVALAATFWLGVARLGAEPHRRARRFALR